MNENERTAVNQLKNIREVSAVKLKKIDKGSPDAKPLVYISNIKRADIFLRMINELEAYRAIGTVEEFEQAKKYIKLAKIHGTVGQVIDACAEYEEIGTVEECRAAVEKQKAKKMESPWCSCCGKFLTTEYMNKRYHCIYCGQLLKWEENEE